MRGVILQIGVVAVVIVEKPRLKNRLFNPIDGNLRLVSDLLLLFQIIVVK